MKRKEKKRKEKKRKEEKKGKRVTTKITEEEREKCIDNNKIKSKSGKIRNYQKRKKTKNYNKNVHGRWTSLTFATTNIATPPLTTAPVSCVRQLSQRLDTHI